MSSGHKKRSRLRSALLAFLLCVVALGVVAGFGVWQRAQRWQAEIAQLAEIHMRREVTHLGWSFPGRVYTDEVPLDAPAWRLVAEARARGYTEHCPDPAPGQYCEAEGRVAPRSGHSLEPLLLGWLVGPDAEIRAHLPYADAPRHLLDAIVAAEDQDFYEHRGVHLSAFARAALANLRQGGYAQGASTLTMQVVRIFTQRREKTLGRKLRELVMAHALDRRLGKQGVLQVYLDAPYLGQSGSLSICGFEAAALHYFDKTARELSLAESATLAAILPAPGRFDPRRFPKRAKARRDQVLRALAQRFGYDVTEALQQAVRVSGPLALESRYPAYLSAVRSWLGERLDDRVLHGAGLRVGAAIDLPLQEITQKLIAERTRLLESMLRKQPQPLQAAAVLLDVESGRLQAIYGGHDISATDFNRALQAWRQPGSAFKPVVYALAFGQPPNEDGSPRFTAASTQPNTRRRFKFADRNWVPRNVKSEYTPTASLAYALAGSQNVATVSLLETLGGPQPLLELSARLGFDTSRFPAEMGLALGQAEVTPLQMAQLVATIANGGRLVQASPVTQVLDSNGRERLGMPGLGEQVLSVEAAALTRELMEQVVRNGTGGTVRGIGGMGGYRGEVIGKTGTTDDEKDSWFVGATPQQAGALWLGYDEPTRLGGTASDLAAPLWGWWFGALNAQQEELPSFADEPQLSRRVICGVTGLLVGEACKGIYAPFLPGTEPHERCVEPHPPPHLAEGDDPDAPPAYESLWKRREREASEDDKS